MIGFCVYVINANIENIHLIICQETERNHITMDIRSKIHFSLCLHPATPCILGFLVTSAGVYADTHMSAQSLFSRLFRRPKIPPLLKRPVCCHINSLMQLSHARRILWRGRSRWHCKAYLKSYLDISVSSWEMVSTVSLCVYTSVCVCESPWECVFVVEVHT